MSFKDIPCNDGLNLIARHRNKIAKEIPCNGWYEFDCKT